MRVLLCTSTSAAITTVRAIRRSLRGAIGPARLGFDENADRPNESEQLAGDRRHGLRLILAAREHALESPVQAMLRLPSDLGYAGTEARVPFAQRGPHGGAPAIGPRRFDHHPSHVRVAGLGDTPRATAFTRGVLTRNQAAVAHQLRRALKSRELVHFG